MNVEPVEQPANRQIIVGVDTHEHVHVAVATNHLRARLVGHHVAANRESSAQVEALSAALAGNGRVLAFGVKGTRGYGAVKAIA